MLLSSAQGLKEEEDESTVKLWIVEEEEEDESSGLSIMRGMPHACRTKPPPSTREHQSELILWTTYNKSFKRVQFCQD